MNGIKVIAKIVFKKHMLNTYFYKRRNKYFNPTKCDNTESKFNRSYTKWQIPIN